MSITFAKQSMINRLSNPINRNCLAAKISKVMSSNHNPYMVIMMMMVVVAEWLFVEEDLPKVTCSILGMTGRYESFHLSIVLMPAHPSDACFKVNLDCRMHTDNRQFMRLPGFPIFSSLCCLVVT